MDESPLAQNQGTLASTDVGSPLTSDFGAARSRCSKLRDDIGTLPSGDAEPRESSSTDNELCEERHESEQASSFSCSAPSYPRTPSSQEPDILRRHESTDAPVSPDAANNFGLESTSCTTDFQTSKDGNVAGGDGRSSQLNYPLLESLLVWDHSSGDEKVSSEHKPAVQAERTMDNLVPLDAEDSFGFELMDFTTDFQWRNDGSVDGGVDNESSRSACPLLKVCFSGATAAETRWRERSTRKKLTLLHVAMILFTGMTKLIAAIGRHHQTVSSILLPYSHRQTQPATWDDV